MCGSLDWAFTISLMCHLFCRLSAYITISYVGDSVKCTWIKHSCREPDVGSVSGLIVIDYYSATTNFKINIIFTLY